MRSATVLAALARRLNREAGSPPLPALYFFTDPQRTPDPAAIAATLPRGTAIVYRHFGADERVRIARDLRRVARARDLPLLIAADPELARRVGADGVHWPERLLGSAHQRHGITLAAAHSARAVERAAALGADACVLAPVFQTNSASGNAPLGLIRASRIARNAPLPIIALGGVNTQTAERLPGRGFAGCAAVEALIA